jgi:regulator of replication initiation timing
MNKKNMNCYTGIFNTIDGIEERIMEIKKQLATLKKSLSRDNGTGTHTDEIKNEETPLDSEAQGDI